MEHERIIYILEYLTSHTDEKKKVTIRDIQNYLASQTNLGDVSALTIRRDISRLQTTGHNIQVSRGAHNTAEYYLIKKGFTFNEIRFIVDSVSINKFLSDGQKQRLIKKFEGLCSAEEVHQLISQIALNSQASPSLNLLENLEKVHKIISQKRKINFEYGKYDTHKQIHYYSKRRDMIPCKVIYFNERFYLKCLEEASQNIRTYRIDRMKRITAGEQTAVKAFLSRPDGVVLDIFEPEEFTFITLKIKRFLLDDMLEQFGRYASVLDSDSPETVLIRAKIGIGHGFYRWVMKYGSDMEIIAPEHVRAEFAEKLCAVAELYQK
ncbi:MAG: WYL domain-containing protein [Oscillospiraceae bacterium]|nr:WYL domain-containing protein [Oscillospiraceae bacterium]